MPAAPRRLPPLTSLASFEAAARHVSFKTAAGDLNVTPAAISHQVKSLEAEMGLQLFQRHHRGVELTEAGAFLYVAIQRGFDTISDAIGQLRLRTDDDAVTIEATTAVSSLWLAPRLTRFWSEHGSVPVSQNVTDMPTVNSVSDLKIYYGDPDREQGDSHLLFRDRIAVLAAPGFAERHGVGSLADLARVPLIHLTAEDNRWTGWHTFLSQVGYDGPLGAAFYVNNHAIALQCAQDGAGAVLGWESLAADLLSRGTLERLIPEDIRAPHSFYIRTRRNAPAKATLLRDWLLASSQP